MISLRLSVFLLVVASCISLNNADDLPELKIEVLHKPEECEQKSQKGHLLSMHYKGTFEDGKQFDSRYLYRNYS